MLAGDVSLICILEALVLAEPIFFFFNDLFVDSDYMMNGISVRVAEIYKVNNSPMCTRIRIQKVREVDRVNSPI